MVVHSIMPLKQFGVCAARMNCARSSVARAIMIDSTPLFPALGPGKTGLEADLAMTRKI
jgi:hypothetical protein